MIDYPITAIIIPIGLVFLSVCYLLASKETEYDE